MNDLNENNQLEHKKQLFDFQFVCEIVTAAIILFLIEERHEDGETLDDEQVADFVLKNFPEIVDSITADSNEATDANDAG
jgi:hypothetical protein